MKLTEGKIFTTLLKLALPIAAGQVMHMAYNLTDMFWLGRVDADAVAAAGAAGLFLWLSVGLMLVGRVGAEVGVSQARGKNNIQEAFDFSQKALYIAAVLGVVYGLFLLIFRNHLVAFFGFNEVHVARDAALYAGIMALGTPAMFISSAIGGTFVASGNSRTPLFVNSAGLIFNMMLTPVFVFVFGLGVFGAAVSSVISQYTVFIIFVFGIKKFKSRPFEQYKFLPQTSLMHISTSVRTGTASKIFKITVPVALENTIFPLLALVTTRIEVGFGAFALSMSRVATQVESLSWLVGAGFGAALTAYVGQNYGAKQFDRIKKGVNYATYFLVGWGLFVTLLLWFGGYMILNIFLPEFALDPEMMRLFIMNTRILAACQIFSNLEFVATNTFRGFGKTMPPSVIGIASNVIRVPLAFVLSWTPLGVMGVWVAVSFTAGLRGLVMYLWYRYQSKKYMR